MCDNLSQSRQAKVPGNLGRKVIEGVSFSSGVHLQEAPVLRVSVGRCVHVSTCVDTFGTDDLTQEPQAPTINGIKHRFH